MKFLRKKNKFELKSKVVLLNSYKEVMKLYGWCKEPILDEEFLYTVNFLEDVNERKVRDAESILTICANHKAKTILEIGTAEGKTTYLISKNSPLCDIYTINLLPEDINDAGENITFALEKEKIGAYYRKKDRENIKQIYTNSKNWEPDIGNIDIAYIDGCHDKEFVINDTIKIINNMKPGGFILWHDFNPSFRLTFSWIDEVCKGVEYLYDKGYLKNRILQIKDSWVGIYQV